MRAVALFSLYFADHALLFYCITTMLMRFNELRSSAGTITYDGGQMP